MKHIVSLIVALLTFCLVSCQTGSKTECTECCKNNVQVEAVLPITGTFLNLPYQDVRNKYTNPLSMDYTDPQFWTVKVNEMAKMGMEYLVLMAVANE